MSWQVLLAPFSDPYERKARGLPALLTVLPMLVLLCCTRGIDQPAPTALFALLSVGGGVTALAAVGRSLGKRLEQQMIERWGALPTTLVLRHQSGHYSRYTLAHIHGRLHNLTGIAMPTASEEKADSHDADARYAAATDRLRQATRSSKFLHLRRENIAYGFYRNALALKPLAVASSAVGTVGGVLLSGAIHLAPAWLDPDRLLAPGVPSAVAVSVSLAIGIVCCSLTQDGLKRVGLAYADRLFECLDTMPAARQNRKNKGIRHES